MMKYVHCYFLFVQINVVYTYSYCHLTNKDIKIHKYYSELENITNSML